MDTGRPVACAASTVVLDRHGSAVFFLTHSMEIPSSSAEPENSLKPPHGRRLFRRKTVCFLNFWEQVMNLNHVQSWLSARCMGVSLAVFGMLSSTMACNNWPHYTDMYAKDAGGISCWGWMDHWQCMDHWTPAAEEGPKDCMSTVQNRRNKYRPEECSAMCGGNFDQDVSLIAMPDGNTILATTTVDFCMCEPLTPSGM